MRGGWTLALLLACGGDPAQPAPAQDVPAPQTKPRPADLRDDPERYVHDLDYRRAILERDLIDKNVRYSKTRLRNYAVRGRRGNDGWERRAIRDWPTVPLTPDAIAGLRTTGEWPFDAGAATNLTPQYLPTTDAEWIELGRRVFFEYPVTRRPVLRKMAAEGRFDELGAVLHEGEYLGVRLALTGRNVHVTTTCATCHASVVDGVPSGILANRAFNLSAIHRFAVEHGTKPEMPVDTTRSEHAAMLGPGRSDVQNDEVFQPYAFPDFGGLVDMPFLHHTGNWRHTGVAALAIRIETVYITGMRHARIPRVLAWALARYIRSLPPPSPLAQPDEASARGARVFAAEGCDVCHAPPTYTSTERVAVDEIGTDPAAALGAFRGAGFYRVPGLRGVGRTAPYLHHGAFASLEAMFDPQRTEPGHVYGLNLDEAERGDLLQFLRTL